MNELSGNPSVELVSDAQDENILVQIPNVVALPQLLHSSNINEDLLLTDGSSGDDQHVVIVLFIQ